MMMMMMTMTTTTTTTMMMIWFIIFNEVTVSNKYSYQHLYKNLSKSTCHFLPEEREVDFFYFVKYLFIVNTPA